MTPILRITRTATTKMSSKGQVVIPENIRNKLKLKAGSQFVVVGEKDMIIFKSISPPSLDQFEARSDFGPGYRLYFGLEGNNIILLLMGGDKRTQKRDITKAHQFWNNYKKEKKIGKKK